MASTPDILAPPAFVADTVARLDASLDATVPAKRPGGNILVATWNIRAFSDLTKAWETPHDTSPLRNFADVHYIAAHIRRFDVVAVQEIRGNLRALRYLLKVLGEQWAFLLTDVSGGHTGNNERLGFLYNTERVKPSGLACELVVTLGEGPAKVKRGVINEQFARTPYAVSFRSADQTFTLVTLHINYGDKPAERLPELTAIAQWLANWAEREFGWHHNLITLGDFNIDRADDPLFDAFTSTGLTPAPPLTNLPRTIFDDPDEMHYYDQIAWFTRGSRGRAVLNLDCVAGGQFDFTDILRGEQTLNTLSWHISDHYPLWVEFGVPR
ncbi:MAG: endonuclease [Actinophytocola sp.]|nr:endonuclease [Actinophytocola sp.]